MTTHPSPPDSMVGYVWFPGGRTQGKLAKVIHHFLPVKIPFSHKIGAVGDALRG